MGKLQAALDEYKGRDHYLERQKKLQKQAQKAKRQRGAVSTSGHGDDVTLHINGEANDEWSGLEKEQEELAAAVNGQSDGHSESGEDFGGVPFSTAIKNGEFIVAR